MPSAICSLSHNQPFAQTPHVDVLSNFKINISQGEVWPGNALITLSRPAPGLEQQQQNEAINIWLHWHRQPEMAQAGAWGRETFNQKFIAFRFSLKMKKADLR